MALFTKDVQYGGRYFDDEFPLAPVQGSVKLKAQSDEFVIWECNGIVATGVPTSIGPADKAEFIVSRISDPGDKFAVCTFASAIGEKIKAALDEANGDIAAAFSDLPAIARLQSVASSYKGSDGEPTNALVLTFVAPLEGHPHEARIRSAVSVKELQDAAAPDGSDHPFDDAPSPEEIAEGRAAVEAEGKAKPVTKK